GHAGRRAPPRRHRRVRAAPWGAGGVDPPASVYRSARGPVRARRTRAETVGRRGARRPRGAGHSSDPRCPRPDAPPSPRACARRHSAGPRAAAFSLPDDPAARRTDAGPARGHPRRRRSGDSSDDPIQRGGLPTMNPQLTSRLRHLRLSGMVDALPGRVAQAEAAPLPHLEFLELLVEDELARRADRLFARRLKQGGIPVVKTLADFDWTFNPKIPKAKLVEL